MLVLAVIDVILDVVQVLFRICLAHVTDVVDDMIEDHDECDDGGSEFCGRKFLTPSFSLHGGEFSELFTAYHATYGN